MRPLFLSLGASILFLGAVGAQSTGESENSQQVPVGQTFLKFTYPIYQEGVLKYTISAPTATGITLNRADAKDLQIQVYENGAVTTTITSPDADLYVNERKMRTKNTVRIERADMTATSQDCDFNLKTKEYVLRTRVKVVLKHFDLSMTPAKTAPPVPASNPAPGPSASTLSTPSTDTK